MGRLVKVLGGLVATSATAVTAAATARSSIPKPPEPDIPALWHWVVGGNDHLALAAAVFSGISAGYSIWQMFQPSPASRAEVETAVGVDGAATRDLLDTGLARAERKADGRHEEMLAAIGEEKSGFTPQDIRDERISEPKALEFGEAVVSYLRGARPELADDLIAQVGAVAARAAGSGSDRDREAAALIAEGNFADAGKLLRDIANSKDRASAEAHREAGRILALTSASEALREFARAAELDPSNWWTWIELCRLNLSLGRIPEARRTAQQALQHAKTDIERAVTECDLGDVEEAAQDLDRARAHYAAHNRITLRILDSEPDEGLWKRQLHISHDRLGRIAHREGQDAAEEHFRKALDLAEAQLAADATDAYWLRSALIAHNKLGDIANARHDLVYARMHFERGLAQTVELTNQDIRNLEWQRDMLVSLEKMGDLELSDEQPEKALLNYQESLEVARKLADFDKTNTAWQRTLGISWCKVASAFEALERQDEALDAYRRSKAILDQVIESSPDHPGPVDDRRWVESRIAVLTVD